MDNLYWNTLACVRDAGTYRTVLLPKVCEDFCLFNKSRGCLGNIAAVLTETVAMEGATYRYTMKTKEITREARANQRVINQTYSSRPTGEHQAPTTGTPAQASIQVRCDIISRHDCVATVHVLLALF